MDENLAQYKEDFDNLILQDTPEYKPNYSVKTNFLNIISYLKSLKNKFEIVVNYLKYLTAQINAEDIVNNVTQNIMTNKINFNILYSQPLSTIELITIQNILYKVNKIRENEYEISKDSGIWNVENLIVDVKNSNGEKLYPIIKTAAGKINIIFSDPISTDFKVIIL